jgi:DNA primase
VGAAWALQEIDLPEYEPLTEDDQDWLLAKYGIYHPTRALLVRNTISGRILIPWPRPDGSIVYWQARARGDEKPKYVGSKGSKPLFVPQFFQTPAPGGKPVLVEGPFDAIRLAEFKHELKGYVPICLGGKSLSATQEGQLRHIVRRGATIRILLDSDALAGALKLRRQLDGLGYVPRVCLLPTPHDPATAPPDILEGVLR